MITEALVISAGGSTAFVEVRRKAACDGCHKNKDGGGCSICNLTGGDAKLSLKVRNPLGAEPGQRVRIETDSRRVLGYAWLVFLLPLLAAALGWWLGSRFGCSEAWGAGGAAVGMALSFVGVGIYSAIFVSRRCDAEIVEILDDGNATGDEI